VADRHTTPNLAQVRPVIVLHLGASSSPGSTGCVGAAIQALKPQRGGRGDDGNCAAGDFARIPCSTEALSFLSHLDVLVAEKEAQGHTGMRHSGSDAQCAEVRRPIWMARLGFG